LRGVFVNDAVQNKAQLFGKENASKQAPSPKIKVGTFPCNFEEEMVTDHTQQKAGQNNLP
jgi:hypothetical protein